MKYNKNQNLKFRNHRGAAKTASNMKDIVDTIKMNDLATLPRYATTDLAELPPVSKGRKESGGLARLARLVALHCGRSSPAS